MVTTHVLETTGLHLFCLLNLCTACPNSALLADSFNASSSDSSVSAAQPTTDALAQPDGHTFRCQQAATTKGDMHKLLCFNLLRRPLPADRPPAPTIHARVAIGRSCALRRWQLRFLQPFMAATTVMILQFYKTLTLLAGLLATTAMRPQPVEASHPLCAFKTRPPNGLRSWLPTTQKK
jgi:hypothetical protein